MLLPLDPDEEIVEEKPRVTRAQTTAVVVSIVCVAMFAAYRFWDSAVVRKPSSRKSATGQAETEQVANLPQTLGMSSDRALPAPKPANGSDSREQSVSLTPGRIDGGSSSSRETPREAAVTAKSAELASWVERDSSKRPFDTQQQNTKRQAPRTGLQQATIQEDVTAVLLRRTKETNARLTTMIRSGDFANAINTAITFHEANPGLAKWYGDEYRELLKLERTATERYFSSSRSSGRRPSYDTGDLDLAVIDHDLMTSYLRAAKPTFAREYFLNAEQGYDRALSAARQRERTASGGLAAKRDIQQITENLGLLYARWAEHKPDATVMRKADAAFWDSERLVNYAEDPSSARTRLIDGKAIVERIRQRLP